MSATQLFYAVLALTAGALIPVMATLNGSLGTHLGSASYAALILFAVGFVSVATWIVVTGTPLPASLRNTSALHFTGGIIVAFYILGITFLAPRFGLSNAIFCVVVAQILSSAVIEHFGLLGADLRPFDTQRALGAALLVGGTFLARAP